MDQNGTYSTRKCPKFGKPRSTLSFEGRSGRARRGGRPPGGAQVVGGPKKLSRVFSRLRQVPRRSRPASKRLRQAAHVHAFVRYRRAAAAAPGAPPTLPASLPRRKKWAASRRRPLSVPAVVRVGHACAGARGEQGRGGCAAGSSAQRRGVLRSLACPFPFFETLCALCFSSYPHPPPN